MSRPRQPAYGLAVQNAMDGAIDGLEVPGDTGRAVWAITFHRRGVDKTFVLGPQRNNTEEKMRFFIEQANAALGPEFMPRVCRRMREVNGGLGVLPDLTGYTAASVRRMKSGELGRAAGNATPPSIYVVTATGRYDEYHRVIPTDFVTFYLCWNLVFHTVGAVRKFLSDWDAVCPTSVSRLDRLVNQVRLPEAYPALTPAELDEAIQAVDLGTDLPDPPSTTAAPSSRSWFWPWVSRSEDDDE